MHSNLKSVWPAGPADGFRENWASLYLVLESCQRDKQSRILLIFDNTGNLDVVKYALPPENFRIDVLICLKKAKNERVKSCQILNDDTICDVELSALSLEESMELLSHRSRSLQLAQMFTASGKETYNPAIIAYAANRMRRSHLTDEAYFRKNQEFKRRSSNRDSNKIGELLARFGLSEIRNKLCRMDRESIKSLLATCELSLGEKEGLRAVINVIDGVEPELYPWEVEVARLREDSPSSYDLLLYCTVLGTVSFPEYLPNACVESRDLTCEERFLRLAQLCLVEEEKDQKRGLKCYRMPSLIQSSIRRRFLGNQFTSRLTNILYQIVRLCPSVADLSKGHHLHDAKFLQLLPSILSAAKPILGARYCNSDVVGFIDLVRAAYISLGLPQAIELCKASVQFLPLGKAQDICFIDVVQLYLKKGFTDAAKAELKKVKVISEERNSLAVVKFLALIQLCYCYEHAKNICCCEDLRPLGQMVILPFEALIQLTTCALEDDTNNVIFSIAKELLELRSLYASVFGQEPTGNFRPQDAENMLNTISPVAADHLDPRALSVFMTDAVRLWRAVLENFPYLETAQQKMYYFTSWLKLLLADKQHETAIKTSDRLLQFGRSRFPQGHFVFNEILQIAGDCCRAVGKKVKAAEFYKELLKSKPEICSNRLNRVDLEFALAQCADSNVERGCLEVVERFSDAVDVFWALTKVMELCYEKEDFAKILEIRKRTKTIDSQIKQVSDFYLVALARNTLIVSKTLMALLDFAEPVPLLESAVHQCADSDFFRFFPSTRIILANLHLCLAECYAYIGEKDQSLSCWENAYHAFCETATVSRQKMVQALVKLVQCKVCFIKLQLENYSSNVRIERLEFLASQLDAGGDGSLSAIAELLKVFRSIDDAFVVEKCREIKDRMEQQLLTMSENDDNCEDDIPLHWLDVFRANGRNDDFVCLGNDEEERSAGDDVGREQSLGENDTVLTFHSPILKEYANELKDDFDSLAAELNLSPTAI